MARTLIDASMQIASATITRALLNTTTAGSAVVAKIVAGTGVSLSSTGVDAGTGDVTINATSSYTGGTLTSGETLAANSTSLTPIKFQSGSLNTTAAAGGLEFDGTAFYASAAASTRQVINTAQCMVLSSAYTLANSTSAQKLFNATTNGAVTLPVGTYEFECEFSLSSLSASTSTFGFALGGTATFTQAWSAFAIKNALATASSDMVTFNTAANTAISPSNTTATGWARIRGIIRVTVAGTIIPQVSTSVGAPGPIVGVNSFFRIAPLGASAFTNVGNWS